MSYLSFIINNFLSNDNNDLDSELEYSKKEFNKIISEINRDISYLKNNISLSDIDKKYNEINIKFDNLTKQILNNKILINRYILLKKQKLNKIEKQTINPYENASAPNLEVSQKSTQILEIKINRDVMEIIFKEILLNLAFEDLRDYYTVLIADCVNNKNDNYKLINSLSKLICLIKRDDLYLNNKKIIIVDLPVSNERISDIKKKVSNLINDIENTKNISVKESIAEKIINLLL